jgi:ATP-dependent RNA helicase DeaD
MNLLKFNDLALSQEMMHAISDLGFTNATPIQSQAIPFLMEGKDVTGQAQTGTGKTAAFGIPMIEAVNANSRGVTGIVLVPTRELAVQVAEELSKLAKYKKGVRIAAIYGGMSIFNQTQELKKGVNIVVGTPGRVMDHLQRKTLTFNDIKMVVLDEADEMLNMGFRPDIERMLRIMPRTRQTVMFSATMSAAILDITKSHQQNPQMVKVTPEKLTAPAIEQTYFEVNGPARVALIATLLEAHSLKLVIVFCNTKRRADALAKSLRNNGMKAEPIHGNLSQNKRNAVLAAFKKGDLNLLVATDVAARGIDVNDVDAVINYDVPMDQEYYVHRIGRTGRAGKTGKAFTLVTGGDEMRRLKSIEKYSKVTVVRSELPAEFKNKMSTMIINEPPVARRQGRPEAQQPRWNNGFGNGRGANTATTGSGNSTSSYGNTGRSGGSSRSGGFAKSKPRNANSGMPPRTPRPTV